VPSDDTVTWLSTRLLADGKTLVIVCVVPPSVSPRSSQIRAVAVLSVCPSGYGVRPHDDDSFGAARVGLRPRNLAVKRNSERTSERLRFPIQFLELHHVAMRHGAPGLPEELPQERQNRGRRPHFLEQAVDACAENPIVDRCHRPPPNPVHL
jgi:hypothetical protein